MNVFNVDSSSKILWDYLCVRDNPQKADAMFVFGRNDFNIPEKALQLYKEGWAPLLVLLGGTGRLSGDLKVPESEVFRDYLLQRRVPKEALLLDTVSTNTGENVDAGLELLQNSKFKIQNLILVTHAPHARRTIGAVQIRRPDITLFSCPDDCSLPDSGSEARPEALKEIMGEIERLVTYTGLGYIQEQNIPKDIITAYDIVSDWFANKDNT